MAGKKTDDTVSMPAMLKALADGETFSRSRRVPFDSEDAGDIVGVLAGLRNKTNQAVVRVRKETGTNFRVESGTYLTDDKTAVLATVAVTRIDGEDDDNDPI